MELSGELFDDLAGQLRNLRKMADNYARDPGSRLMGLERPDGSHVIVNTADEAATLILDEHPQFSEFEHAAADDLITGITKMLTT